MTDKKEPMVRLKIREDHKGKGVVSGYFPGAKVNKGAKARNGEPVLSDLRVKPGEVFEVPQSEAKMHLRTKLVEIDMDLDDDEAVA